MNEAEKCYRTSLDDLDGLLHDGSDRKLIVDFDYTLLRSNSTEEFLNCARPGSLAGLLLKALGALQPWALGPKRNGSSLWRDPIRTWAIMILMPWTLWLFRSKATGLFSRFVNQELERQLEPVDDSRIIIVSAGFQPFIRWMLADSPFRHCRLIAGSFTEPLLVRGPGKLLRLRQMSIDLDRGQDIVITDSLDDQDILDAVDHAYLIEPDTHDVRPALADTYVPFMYTAKAKRTPAFVIKQMMLEELPVALLGTVFFVSLAPGNLVGAALLFLAYLMVYEIGYAENDRIGLARETNPKLNSDYAAHKNMPLEPDAWIWATLLTIGAVFMLDETVITAALGGLGLATEGTLADRFKLAAIWMTLVALGRGIFYLFNHAPIVWRVYIYAPLHFSKYFSLILIFASQPAGYALLCAQVVRTWALYAIRRAGGDIETTASQTVRLTFFVLFLAAFSLARPDASVLADWHTWVILAWCVLRAAPEASRKLLSARARQQGMRDQGQ